MKTRSSGRRALTPAGAWEWAAAGLILGFMLLAFTYVDLKSLTVWSTNLLDVLYEGRFSDYYAYCAANVHSAPHLFMGGDLVGIVPWAVWNLPIWICQRFFHVDVLASPLAMLWSKLFLVFVFLLILWLTYRTALLLTKEKEQAAVAVFLCASSLYVFSALGFAGQNDVLLMLPSAAGVYYLLKGERRAFYLLSAFSIGIKPFFLFAYIAVILLLEKNLLRAAGKVLFGFSFLIVFRILFGQMPMYQESLLSGTSDDVFQKMFFVGLDSSLGKFSIFVILLCIFYIWCYIKRTRGREETQQAVLYAVTTAYILLVLCTIFEFYRPILLLPFLYLTFLANKRALLPSVLLDTLMAPCLTFMVFMRESQAYRPYALEHSLLRLPEVNPLLRRFPTPTAMVAPSPVYAIIMVVCAVAILVLNYPGNRWRLPPALHRCPRFLYWLRLCVPLIFITISFLCYFWV